MKRFFPVVLLMLLFTSSFAVVPEAMKYQAVARDNSGNVLANRLVSIRLSILKNNVSGLSVYTETHSITTNALGMINLEIGNGTVVSGAMGSINWGDDSYFIKVEMDENGGSNYSMVGTSQLVSVPYSLYAKVAGNGTQWSDTTVNIYYNTGSVGIGTKNPKAALEVDARTGHNVLITGETPTIRLSDTAFTGNGVIVGVAADSNDLITGSGKGDMVFTNEAYNTGGGYIFGVGIPLKTAVKITKAGKLGIGTGKPRGMIEVEALGSAADIYLKGNNQNDAYAGIRFITDDPVEKLWAIFHKSNGIEKNNLDFVYNDGAVWTHIMALAANGNVGIGTWQPLSKLQVRSGDIYIEDITFGVIMKSPNGVCWKMTMSNAGTPVYTSVTCP